MFGSFGLKMNISVVLKAILILALLIGGIFFSKEAIEQYIEGRTAFDVLYRPITLDDVPVLTLQIDKHNLCGEEDPEYTILYTAEINNVIKTFDLNSSIQSQEGWISAEKYCFTHRKDGGQYVPSIIQRISTGKYFYGHMRKNDLRRVKIELDINFRNSNTSVEIPIAVSSVDGSYSTFDVHNSRSFDGKYGVIILKKNRSYVARLHVKETRYLEQRCSKIPYYEKVGAKMKENNFAPYNFTYQQGNTTNPCPSLESMCLTRAFPIDIPKCNKSASTTLGLGSCFEQALTAVTNEILETADDSSKTCHVKGYFVEDHYDYPDTNYQYHLVMDFFVPSTIHIQTSTVLKLVHEEYYIMNEIGLIGAIGGTLGLFIGLSFLDVSFKSIDWIKKKIRRDATLGTGT